MRSSRSHFLILLLTAFFLAGCGLFGAGDSDPPYVGKWKGPLQSGSGTRYYVFEEDQGTMYETKNDPHGQSYCQEVSFEILSYDDEEHQLRRRTGGEVSSMYVEPADGGLILFGPDGTFYEDVSATKESALECS